MARRKYYNFYNDDFKATVVALTEIPGIQSNHVADALDIHEVMLYRWRMEASPNLIVNMSVERLEQVWVGEITCIKLVNGVW